MFVCELGEKKNDHKDWTPILKWDEMQCVPLVEGAPEGGWPSFSIGPGLPVKGDPMIQSVLPVIIRAM